MLCEYFEEHDIGKVVRIIPNYKVNENQNCYWYAILHVVFANTPTGKNLYNTIVVQKKTICMDYKDKLTNKSLYWEVSLGKYDASYNNPMILPVESKKPQITVPEPPVVYPPLQMKGLLTNNPSVKNYVPEMKPYIASATNSLLLPSYFGMNERMEIYNEYLDIEREIYTSYHYY